MEQLQWRMQTAAEVEVQRRSLMASHPKWPFEAPAVAAAAASLLSREARGRTERGEAAGGGGAEEEEEVKERSREAT